MTKELRKRPFARPLFIWIMGICLSVYVPFEYIAVGLFCICLILIFFSFYSHKERCLYSERWQWGAWYLLLLLALSCAYVYYHLRAEPSDVDSEWQVWCRVCQQSMLEPIALLNLADWEKNVLATLTLGYRQELDWTVRERFSLAGAAHILAVSGFHVGVVYSFLRLCLFPLSDKSRLRYLKAGLLLVSIWLFAAITGLAASAVRAAWMLSLYLFGVTIRKKRDSYNTWCATAFCMLVYNPFYLFDIGFQLSFLTVLSIFFFYRRISSLFQLRNPFIRTPWDWFAISLAAQIGTFPLCLYYFGEMSSVSLLAALPVSFFSILIIPLALLWIVLVKLGWVCMPLQELTSWLTDAFCTFVDRIGRVDPITPAEPLSVFMLFEVYLSLLFLCFYIREKYPRYLLSSFFFFFLFSASMLIERIS